MSKEQFFKSIIKAVKGTRLLSASTKPTSIEAIRDIQRTFQNFDQKKSKLKQETSPKAMPTPTLKPKGSEQLR